MSNPKYKFYGLNTVTNNSKLLVTESHPKLDASQEDLGAALTAVAGIYDNMLADRVDLTSDTTVYTAE